MEASLSQIEAEERRSLRLGEPVCWAPVQQRCHCDNVGLPPSWSCYWLGHDAIACMCKSQRTIATGANTA